VEGHRVGESTKAGYRRLIRLHVKPYIGEVELAKLTSTRLAALYRKLESEGRRNHKGELTGEGLGPNSVHKVHQALSVAIDSGAGRREDQRHLDQAAGGQASDKLAD